jgi:hypothetical protein
MSERDWAILGTADRLRVATGPQLERVHFAGLSERSRARNRRNVLHRLSDWRVLAPLERRIGGTRAGSDGLVFALDSIGQQLLQHAAVRRPHTPLPDSLKHALAVSELVVSVLERARSDGFEVLSFAAEPWCWVPDGLGGYRKPDAHLRLATRTYVDDWWIERDMHTKAYRSEDLPTIRRKLLEYLDFAERGQVGPNGVLPRVLFAVEDERRRAGVAKIIESLPDPASQLFHVATADVAASYLAGVLLGEG